LYHQQLKGLTRLCDVSAQAIAQQTSGVQEQRGAHFPRFMDMTDPSIAVDPLPVITYG
jgi:hypothetical protein